MQHCDCEARNRDSVVNDDARHIWRGYPTDDDSNVLSSDLHELHKRLTSHNVLSVKHCAIFLCDLSSKERAANAMHACPADCSDIHEPNVNSLNPTC